MYASADVAGDAAAFLGRALGRITASGRRASFAVSGGTTPWLALEQLAAVPLDWPLVDVFQVDERIVGPDSTDRNWRALDDALLSRVPAVGHPMPVGEVDLDAAAARYAAGLPRDFDVVQLGLGADGHTASLIPGDPICDVADRDVAVSGIYQGNRRMSLTFPALNRAATILWIVNGASKREALARLVAGDRSIPAGRIEGDNATVVADRAALGDLASDL